MSRRASIAGAVNLAHLRWRHWGARHATATGVDLGFPGPHPAPTPIAVKVTADHRQAPCANAMAYEHVKIRYPGRTVSLWLAPGCAITMHEAPFANAVKAHIEAQGGVLSVVRRPVCELGHGDLWRCQAEAEWSDGVGSSCDNFFSGHYTRDADIIIDSPFRCT